MSCQQTLDGLVDLIVALSRYREEGVPLFPKFIICEDLTSAVGLVSGSEAIEIGAGSLVPSTFKDALKKCAPLACDGWVAYIHRKAKKIRFGVFRQAPSPTAIPIRDTICRTLAGDTMNKSGGMIFISQLAENAVELVGARGSPLIVHLDATNEAQPPPLKSVENLIETIVCRTDRSMLEPCTTFLKALFIDVLRRGHGTLIAVVEEKRRLPKELTKDGISLRKTVDIEKAVADHLANPSCDTLSRLRDYASLIEGMLSSDGITVFKTKARISSFRVFVNDPAPKENKTSDTGGGARRRAFGILRNLVDKKQVAAVFIRSVDGSSEFYEGNTDGVK